MCRRQKRFVASFTLALMVLQVVHCGTCLLTVAQCSNLTYFLLPCDANNLYCWFLQIMILLKAGQQAKLCSSCQLVTQPAVTKYDWIIMSYYYTSWFSLLQSHLFACLSTNIADFLGGDTNGIKQVVENSKYFSYQ